MISEELMRRYVSGDLDPAEVMSVEAHLMSCTHCRYAVPADPGWLEESWAAIEDVVDRPSLTFAERTLIRLGVPEHIARLLAASPTLSRAWLVAVAVVAGFGIVMAKLDVLPFLVGAPVLPLAGIAVAYGPVVDPAHEMHAATPLSGMKLLLIRAVAVIASAMVLIGLAAPFLPGPAGLSLAWLLPALTLATACLLLSVYLPVYVGGIGLTGVWLVGVLVAGELTGDTLTPFQPSAQVLYGCTSAALIAVLFVRLRAMFLEGRS